ncbi:fluoride efflux transporter CrcB [Candidatus Albibeggiatoa sp. nov. NOAA]|uniref:fluoride efflux transporter CrcB n=1 Tax=Candidatus Albibeggiatoa sp. nov. NOAA TaxID=3162724 RepID=UPI0033423AEF
MMLQVAVIALGGALGALMRFWVSTGFYTILGRDFPYGTLAVNLIGSLLMGFLSIWMLDKAVAPEWKMAVLVGFLGAFTTFSTFSLDTLYLIETEAYFKALLNVLSNVILCVFAVWVGMLLARQLS